MTDSIMKRRSIRKFKTDPIPKELLGKILQAGIAAPSSKNRQPWKFIVVSGSAKTKMLQAFEQGLLKEEEQAALLPDSRQYLRGAQTTLSIMRQAPVTVFVMNTLGLELSDALTPEERIYEICNTQSIGAALENMAVAAQEAGVGSLWICDIFFAYEELGRFLDSDGQLTAAMAFGFADESPAPRPRKSMEEAVEWRE